MRHLLIIQSRLFKYGVQNFFRNAWLSVAATAVMIVAITIASASFILNVTARNAIQELSKDIKVSIYLQEGIKESDREILKSALKENKAVVEVEYINRDMAQQRLKNQQDTGFVDQTLALLGVEALPESFDVSVNDLDKLEEVGNIARQEKFNKIVGQNPDDITLGKTRSKETIERASGAQRIITLGSITAAGIFVAVSILIIFNTIRMAIYTRSEEIKIMKLIGATPSYIRGPFYVESAFYGVIAGIVGSAITFGGVFTLGKRVADQREFIETYQFFTDYKVIALMASAAIIAGIFVGVVSSGLAMVKHLRLRHW
jgi:cell division transport system permease protein